MDAATPLSDRAGRKFDYYMKKFNKLNETSKSQSKLLEEKQKEIDALITRNDKYNDEYNNLQKRYAESDRIQKALIEQCEKMKSVISDCVTEADSTVESRPMNGENGEQWLKNRLDQLKRDNDLLGDELARKTQELSSKDEELKAAGEENESLLDRLDRIKNELDEAEQIRARLLVDMGKMGSKEYRRLFRQKNVARLVQHNCELKERIEQLKNGVGEGPQ